METMYRLTIRAKRAALRKGKRFYAGFVGYDPARGIWLAKGDLWTGKPGSGRRIVTEHGTKDAAIAALQALAEKYPNTVEDAVIFICDITE